MRASVCVEAARYPAHSGRLHACREAPFPIILYAADLATGEWVCMSSEGPTTMERVSLELKMQDSIKDILIMFAPAVIEGLTCSHRNKKVIC